jgi:hypothetical protein
VHEALAAISVYTLERCSGAMSYDSLADVVIAIVWGIAAILLALGAWAIMTGRHRRYYNSPDKRPDWVPPELIGAKKSPRKPK